MNIEELKLIIEMVKTLSGDATSALIWWLAFDMAKYVLGGSFFLVLSWMVIRSIAGTSDWARAGRDIATAYGARNVMSFIFDNDDREAIAKAIAKARESK